MGCNNFRRGTEKYYRPPVKKSGEEKIRDYFNTKPYRLIDDIYYSYNSDEEFDKAIKNRLEKIVKNETESRKEDSKVLR